MRTRLMSFLAAAAGCAMLIAGPLLAQQPTSSPRCKDERLALVLSGGGARGLAHVGVLEALDSAGVRPDLIVGTSMGALVGALYAGGIPAHTLDSLARRLPLAALFTRASTPGLPGPIMALVDPIRAGSPGGVSPATPLLLWEMGSRGLVLKSPVSRDAAVNALLTRLFLTADVRAAGDFDRLPIPFRAIATDLATTTPIVLARGDLAQAVRASVAIPVVLPPVRIDGRVLVDGGLSANLPVRFAREAGATRIIASDAQEPLPPDSLAAMSIVTMAEFLTTLLSRQSPDSLASSDMLIVPDLGRARALDWAPEVIARHIEAGKREAAHALATWKSGCAAIANGDSHDVRKAEATPPEHPDSASLTSSVGRRVQAALQSGDYAELWLNPSRVPGSDSIAFTPVARPAPRRVAALGAMYDNQRGGAVALGARDATAFDGRLTLATGLVIGEWRQAGAFYVGSSRMHLAHDDAIELSDPRTELPPWSSGGTPRIAPSATVRLAHERVRVFSSDGAEQGWVPTFDALLVTGIDMQWRNWFVLLGPAAARWHVSSPAPSSSDGEEDDLRREFGRNVTREDRSKVGAFLRVSHMLDAGNASSLMFGPSGGAAEARLLGDVRRVELSAAQSFDLGSLLVRTRADVGWGQHLPPQATFPLGGSEGFPGLVDGEQRGDRSATVGLTMLRSIRGPLSLYSEAAIGTARYGGAVVPGNWRTAGVALGLQLTTAIGALRTSYGRASGGRHALFVGVGR